MIFGFAGEDDSDVVYVDSDTAPRVYETRNPVRQCTYTFDAALAQALAPRESADLIREVIKELAVAGREVVDAGVGPGVRGTGLAAAG